MTKPTALRVRTLKVHGATRIVLCDADGRLLPGQRETQLNCQINSFNQLLVEFIIDGTSIVQELDQEAIK